MRSRRLILPLLLTAGLAACGGGDNGSTPNNPAGGPNPSPSPVAPTGTVVVKMTDDPFGDAQAVLITFSDVSVQATSGGFERIPFVSGSASRTCEMKHLSGGKLDLLAQGAVPAGHYTGLRLRISSGTLFFENPTVLPACDAAIGAPRGDRAELTIATSEVTVKRDFDVNAGATTTITADFAGPRSIKRSGANYVLQPVIFIDSVDGP